MTYTVETKEYNARPSRGYHNYFCTITFGRTPQMSVTDEGQAKIVENIRTYHGLNMMWCHPAKHLCQDMWSFEYGYDSGD